MMDMGETIRKVVQELIVPELEIIKAEGKEVKTILEFTNKRIDDVNKRIDDVNLHLVDQSRRIDELRIELKDEIAKTNMRIDETNKRIDRLYEVIVRRDEYDKLEMKIMMVEQEMSQIKLKMAA